jgi:hypothetical protein
MWKAHAIDDSVRWIIRGAIGQLHASHARWSYLFMCAISHVVVTVLIVVGIMSKLALEASVVVSVVCTLFLIRVQMFMFYMSFM